MRGMKLYLAGAAGLAALAALGVSSVVQTTPAGSAPSQIRHPMPAPSITRPLVAPICRTATPKTATEFNTMLGRVKGWQAGDGGTTAMLDSGRRAWMFGDSLLADGQLHHNALVIQTKGCAESMEMATEFIPNSACGDDPSTAQQEAYCWGGPMAYSNGRLYILAQVVRSVPDCTGAFCFAGVGTRLFEYTVPPNGKPIMIGGVDIPVTGGVFWGSALSISPDGALAYVYGYRDDGDQWTFGYDAYLAVTDVAGLADFNSWTFYTGTDTWSQDPADAKPVLGAVGGPETGFSVTFENGGTTLTSTADGGLGHVVTEWTSPNPWGPWTSRAIADYPDTVDHMWYLPQRIAGSALHVISQNWPHRPLSDIPAHPADFRVVVF